MVTVGGNLSNLTSDARFSSFVVKTMDKEKFFEVLDSIYSTSTGLKSYLGVAMRTVEVKKNVGLPADHNAEFPFSFLTKGTLKTDLMSKVNPGHHQIVFYFENDILSRYTLLNEEDYGIETRAIQDSTLLVIPKKHVFNLYRFFPEFHVLMEHIRAGQSAKLLHALLDAHHTESQQRLAKVLKERPDIFQIVSVQDVAAFIGIHPHTLSTLRKQNGI